MKAEELMIGDRILKGMNYSEENPMYTRPDYQPYQIQNGEDIDLACETNCIGDADVYQPIPLTEEILEKNGFILIDEKDKYYRWEYAEGIYVNADFKSEEPYVYISNRCYFASPVCRYVHELQHALKICGINKEIKI